MSSEAGQLPFKLVLLTFVNLRWLAVLARALTRFFGLQLALAEQMSYLLPYRRVCQWPLDCAAGTVSLPDGVEMVMPGDNVTAKFELISPVAMEPGLRFAMREGGRTVGAGVVSKILD